MSAVRWTMSALSVLGVMLSATTAHAFCRTFYCPTEDAQHEPCLLNAATGCYGGGSSGDKPLFWSQKCIGFALNQTASKQVSFDVFKQTAVNALATWQDAACASGKPSIEFHFLGAVSCDKQEYNSDQGNVNLFVFRDDQWPHDNGDTVLALTTLTFDVDTGEIYDADMELNSHDHNFTTTDDIALIDTDLRSVMTHESGHFIGLAHSPDETATMFAKYEGKSTSMRDLAPDDIAAVCAVYPTDREVPACNPEPRHGFESACASPAEDPKGCCTTAPGRAGREGASASLAMLAGLSIFVSRRARRSSRAPRS
ncbi:MAG: matrixin family metalloprotease [Polyangiaceae bacterium]